ncbi:MAG: transposase [Bacteroidales bacterium]|nr:transposase [Bacteroidales bacterium]
MSRTIKYDNRGIAHIYQRGINMSVIFYSIKDVLVFYTVLYTKKNKYGITVLGVVCMYNHYHLTVTARSHEDIANFQMEFESTYAREFNSEIGIKGRVFEPIYGLSNKIGGKKQREATAYLNNNPVEKQLSARALDYRWNFLSYAESDCPYSEKLVVRKASRQIKKCLRQVNCMFRSGCYLNYNFLRECFSRLTPEEANQFVDYVIVKYKVIDYEKVIRLYGSFETMLIAFDSNTGSEHDISEEYSDKSYKSYPTLIHSLIHEYGFANPKEVLKLSYEDRLKLCNSLIRTQDVSPFIAGTLLHVYHPKPKRRKRRE